RGRPAWSARLPWPQSIRRWSTGAAFSARLIASLPALAKRAGGSTHVYHESVAEAVHAPHGREKMCSARARVVPGGPPFALTSTEPRASPSRVCALTRGARRFSFSHFISRVRAFSLPRKEPSMRRTVSVGLTWLLLCAPAFGQALGTITGEVRDSTGAVMPGVTVTVTNTATNASRTAATNEVGLFDFPALQPGNYSIKSELEGFKTATRAVELQVQQTVRVNFTLELGTISEMTTVAGVAPLVETSNATIGTVIENRRIVELPLNGRNYLQLVALSPNVSAEFAGPGQAGDRQGGTRANQQLSISGQRREFNYYTLDGVDNTDVNFNTYIFQPSVDALEEFKVQTGVYSAEFGREASQV